MIKDIRKLNKIELKDWLSFEAGVNNASWFGSGLKVGGIELQQVPEEYAELLMLLKKIKAKKYLSIGIGNGGSFLVETYIQQETLEKSVAVDNSSYWGINQRKSILEKKKWLESKLKDTLSVEFNDSDSVEFLQKCEETFDAIFIDGDHSYAGVKRDYDNALRLMNENGIMIFHDINSSGCPGVVQLWQEIKNENCIEFIHSNTCGIGIFKK